MDYMPHATAQYKPVKAAKAGDPIAVAIGNGSLLGIGYWLLGWRRLAVLSALVSVALVSVAVAVAQPWGEILVVVWWVAVIVHGWFLASRSSQRVASRTQRLVALGVTIPVLLAFGILRYDASGIGHDVAAGREGGDCGKVLSAQDRVWFGSRIANAPLTAEGDKAKDACRQLQTAADKLSTGLTGDTTALSDGFGIMNDVLTKPGNEKTVDTTLDGLLGGLPTKNSCQTVTITGWLRTRKPSDNRLDRSADDLKRVAPAAMLGCADGMVAANQWASARTQYQQLLDLYGDDPLAAKARKGVARANLAIELAKVNGLLAGSNASEPEYCDTPAKYSGAPASHPGINRALIYGNSEYTGKLPAAWRAADVGQAVFVVCAGTDADGPTVRTCPYENKTFPNFPTDVKFHKISIPVKVFEVRTGRLVSSRNVEINGSSCPKILHYTTSSLLHDIGPPGDVYVTPTTAGIVSAFVPLITRK